MKIKESFEDADKEFEVLEYCCDEFKYELRDYYSWTFVNDDLIHCWTLETSYMGRYCPYCGQRIIMIRDKQE